MQKAVEDNIAIIKDGSIPLKKKIRKYKESIELLESYTDIISKLGSVKLKKSTPEVNINNIDELMTSAQEILQLFDDGEITLEKMEQLITLKRTLLSLQKFIKEKKMDTFVVDKSNVISKAQLEEKILIITETPEVEKNEE
jgi:hypothetical protein